MCSVSTLDFLQIQLTKDSRVQWKQSKIEREVWMCGTGGSTCFYGVWKSQPQRTSTAAFIWESECSSTSAAGPGIHPETCPQIKHAHASCTHLSPHCMHTQTCAHTKAHINTKCIHIHSYSKVIYYSLTHAFFIHSAVMNILWGDKRGFALLLHLNDVIHWHHIGPINTTYWHKHNSL